MAVKTISDNTEGNKYHDEQGQFTSPESGSASSGSENFNFGTLELKEEQPEEQKPRLNIKPEMIQAFLAKKKAKQVEKAKAYFESIKSEINEEKLADYEKLTFEEKNELLTNSPLGYDKKKIAKLDAGEQQAILCAEDILNKEKIINNEISLLEKEKKEIQKKSEDEILNSEYANQKFEGIWTHPVTPLSYQTVSKIDPYLKSSSLERKREYYNAILSNPEESFAEKAKASQFLKKLDKFEAAGKAFLEFEKNVQAKYVDNLEEIEAKTNELNALKEKYSYNSPLVLEASKFVETYQDKYAAYSKLRKDKATWIDAKWIKAHPEFQGDGIVDAAKKYFGGKFENMWNNMNVDERDALRDYTGAYSRINEPLRQIYYSGAYNWNANKFVEAVNEMTAAIEKCVWDEDIWVQRGIPANVNLIQMPGSKIKKSLLSISDNDLQSIIGLTFTDNGFYSSGAGKGTGFSSNSLIINTYCPKGTKMAYMNTKGHYAGSSENEMILQRGYSYRITKVEHKGSKYYMDVEVILGSDSQKPVGNDLYQLGSTYLHG